MNGPIACLDIDYFFAQAEELRNPSIRGKPVVVCVYSHRAPDSGAVATSNYVARRFGVKSGMPIKTAKHLLRNVDAVFLPLDKQYYGELSTKVFEIAGKYSDSIETASIDEAFLDLSFVTGGSYDAAEPLMMELKHEIREKVGLSCSVGVAKNKLLAKMAADDAKPDGLVVVRPESVLDYLGPKGVGEIPYVGKKTAEVLNEMGVKTVRDLWGVSIDRLVDRFGLRMGRFLYLSSRGEYPSQVTPREGLKQMSRIITLKRNTKDEEEGWEQLDKIIPELAGRLKRENLSFRGVSVLGFTRDLKLISRSSLIHQYTQDLGELSSVVRRLLRELLASPGGELRRVGIKVYELRTEKGQSRLTDY
ncbi:MAG: DNA polymerase IV [Nitrososphaerota archaeon]